MTTVEVEPATADAAPSGVLATAHLDTGIRPGVRVAVRRPARRGGVGAELRGLFPELGPWTRSALLTGFEEQPRPPDRVTTGDLGALTAHKLAPFLAQWARTNGIELPHEVRLPVERSTFVLTMRARQAVHAAGDLVAGFSALGIDAAVAKGPGLAIHYAVPALRTYGDVDLLVSPRDFVAAHRHLVGRGWDEPAATRLPWPMLDRWSREAVNLYRGHCVDLHHRLSPWSWSARLPTPALLGRAVAVDVGPVTLPCIDGADNLIAAALQLINDHATPGAKLLAWRDLAELGRSLPGDTTAQRIDDAGLSGLIVPLLQSLPDPMRPASLLGLLPQRRVPHPVRTYAMFRAAEHGRVGANHLLRLPVLGAAAYAAGHAVPSPAYLRLRYPAEPQRYLRWWRDILGGGHGTADDVTDTIAREDGDHT